MKKYLLALAVYAIAAGGLRSNQAITPPSKSQAGLVSSNPIDDVVSAALRKRGVKSAEPCPDHVFLRRVYLDVIGSLPEPRVVRRFLRDRNPKKRSVLIDELLNRPEFADYWSMKWCDILRVKSEFPINLWPNAVQAYHRWIHNALRKNMPYDRFARALLTSSGSNFRVPAVNFYRAMQGRKPSNIAQAVALTFMGVRLDKWPKSRSSAMEVFFSRVAYKGTAEWKEEIVFLNPAPVEDRKVVFPDGSTAVLRPDQDPRSVFADWLITSKNVWFRRNIVNRIWAWLLGRGIIHEPDDIRPDNPAAIPELLPLLEKVLVEARYDLKAVYRLILNSRTYQQSSVPASGHADAEALFAHYPVRQLDAEVLIDALCWISGTRERYSSPIPEPFTFIPEGHRTIMLADGSISSPFLDMFGRPARDTGLFSERSNKSTDAQRIHLLNSSHIRQKIERGRRLRSLVSSSGKSPRVLVRWLYLYVLSRYPTNNELKIAQEYFQTKGLRQSKAAVDLIWALINSKEFLCRH